MADQIIKIKMQMEGQANLVAAQREMQKLRAEAQKMHGELLLGTRSRASFDTEMTRLAASMQKFQTQAVSAKKAATDFFTSRNFSGINMMSLGHIVDDLQYINGPMGVRPIINNLMMISAPLALIAVLGDQAWRNWDWLMGVGGPKIDPTLTALENLKKKIEELNGKKIKIGADRAELKRTEELVANLQKAPEYVDSLVKKQTSNESSAASGFESGLADFGASSAIARVRTARYNKALKLDAGLDLDKAMLRMDQGAVERSRRRAEEQPLTAWLDTALRKFVLEPTARKAEAKVDAKTEGHAAAVDAEIMSTMEGIKTATGIQLQTAIGKLKDMLIEGGMDRGKAGFTAWDMAVLGKRKPGSGPDNLFGQILSDFGGATSDPTEIQENIRQLTSTMSLLNDERYRGKITTAEYNDIHDRLTKSIKEQTEALKDWKRARQQADDAREASRVLEEIRRDQSRVEQGNAAQQTRMLGSMNVADRLRRGEDPAFLAAQLEGMGMKPQDALDEIARGQQANADRASGNFQMRQNRVQGGMAGGLMGHARMMGLGNAMQNRALRGQDAGAADADLSLQIQQMYGVGPEVAQRMVDQTRGEYENYEDQMAVARATMGPMADPRVRMAMAAKGAFGRAGIAGTQTGMMGRMQKQMMARQEQMRQRGMAQQWANVEKWLGPEAAAQLKQGPADMPKDPGLQAAEDLTQELADLKEEIAELRKQGVPALINIE